jgi:carbamoylphosphate synthase large subunit
MTAVKKNIIPVKKTPNVLLGSAGTGTAFGAIVSLRRVWCHAVRIVAMDINPAHLVTATLLADAFEKVPPSSDPEFKTILLKILKAHQIDTYLPLLPQEIAIASRLKQEGTLDDSVAILAPSYDASNLCADKLKLGERLIHHGVPVPASSEAFAPFTAPKYFLKLKSGTGSHGAQQVTNAELPKRIAGNPWDWLVQEVCDGPEVTVDAFMDSATGFAHAVCRERIEVKSGVSKKCRLFADDKLLDFAIKIAGALSLDGSFCFQVMKSGKEWVVIDVNPRPGGATAMCVLTGNDFFAATFALKWGEEYRQFFKEITRDHHVTRQYSEFLMGPIQHECGT